MGPDQHDVDELARIERICRDLAEESRVPGEAEALLEMTQNYGREASEKDRGLDRRSDAAEAKKSNKFSKVDRTPLVPNGPKAFIA